MRLPELARLAPLALIEHAIKSHAFFKPSALELKGRPPCNDAAGRLIEAYREGVAEPWLTACLLGFNGHEDGYETAAEILKRGPGLSAESYAGVSMAMIRGERAEADLLRIAETGATRTIRHGAAYGLAELKTRTATDAIVDGALAEQLHFRMAATIVGGDFDVKRVSELASSGERERRVASLVVIAIFHRATFDGPEGDHARALVNAHRETWRCCAEVLLADEPLLFSEHQRATLTRAR